MALSKRLRYEILRRDNHACRYCGEASPGVKLTIDHVVPTSLGGTDVPGNLVAACVHCNAGKAATSPDAPLVDDVAADALRWANAMRRAAAAQRSDRATEQQYISTFCDSWALIREKMIPTVVLPPEGVTRTLRAWRSVGVTEEDIDWALQIAIDKVFDKAISGPDLWRYFCGVVWRMLDQRQTTAREILDVEGVR
jgi:hypothetical protein